MPRPTAPLVAMLALGVAAPLVLVVVLMSAVQEEVDACAPSPGTPSGGGDGMVQVGAFAGKISSPVKGQLGVAHANIPSRAGMSGFRRSMPRVLSTRPDFVSLNEQRSRSLRQIEAAAPGYRAYRDPKARGQAAGTVVLWRTPGWRLVDSGRVLMVPDGPQKWDAGRSATYVTLRGRGGVTVSMMSTHHMINPGKYGPRRPLRQRLYGAGMDRLTGAVAALAERGPVFVAGDMNTHDEQRSETWSAAAKMQGAGYGWVNDSVDFVFYPKKAGVTRAGSWSGDLVSDHDWVAARFNMNGAGPTANNSRAHSTAGAGPDQRTVAGLDPEQTRNAATIVDVGQQLGISDRGLVVALATALQESGLRNLGYGDRDSLGLFQQRPSTGWGTPAEIRDPVKAAQAFFGRAQHTGNTGLVDVADWEKLPITVAAQTVQRSAYPSAYADDEDLAMKILTQLDSGAAATLAAATEPTYCAGGMVPVSSTTCPETGSSVEDGLTPDALLVLRCVEATFGTHDYAGVGERSSNPDSDHPAGRAVDVMIDRWQSAEGIASGDAIAAWLQQNHRAFGIRYLIWRERIWSPGEGGWRPYSHPSGASDPTSRHLDHVHVSVAGNEGTGLTGAVTLPLPAGTYTDQHNWRDGGASWASWHSGNDLSAPCGTPVFAVHAGRIVLERDQPWSGPALVKVSQGAAQPTTWYAHMESVTVTAGQQVAAGQQIGTVGDEGNSHGCHLHLELHMANGSIYAADNTDPMPWIHSQMGTAAPGVAPVAN